MPSSSNSREASIPVARRSRAWICVALGGLALTAMPTAGVAAVTPDQLGKIGLWLSAADLAKTLREGEMVNRWPDRSGNGYDAVFEARIPQAGRTVGVHHPPVLRSVAGLSAVSFNAVDRQTLVLGMAGRALGQKVSGFTAVFLIRPELAYPPAPSGDMPWTPRRYLFISHLSDYSTRVSVQVIQDTGEVRLLSRAVPGAELQRLSSLAGGPRLVLRDHVWQRLVVSVDYGKKETQIFIDGTGVKQALAPAGAGAFEDVPSPITGIGSTTLGDWINSQIAEIICYERALEPDEIHALDAYLCARYHFMP